eukprot:CAMPEP_0206635388 /NCGR_PEP_ID=MMETSP0325_2-20121206/70538_1 /ASSEMBLY_ACC=CAM_ASM_000347 /TAXON_ID=2866 /ORGANISM="Crypthecodinium cohnii, Strain Seligo" /LENGTH=206 /DNA_ID=CAMNT_0054161227 /DNA_START=87 /DNA_END=709 /DNA_ORIENTATION=-
MTLRFLCATEVAKESLERHAKYVQDEGSLYFSTRWNLQRALKGTRTTELSTEGSDADLTSTTQPSGYSAVGDDGGKVRAWPFGSIVRGVLRVATPLREAFTGNASSIAESICQGDNESELGSSTSVIVHINGEPAQAALSNAWILDESSGHLLTNQRSTAPWRSTTPWAAVSGEGRALNRKFGGGNPMKIDFPGSLTFRHPSGWRN